MSKCKVVLGGEKVKLETYGKLETVKKQSSNNEEGVLTKMWNKTIFPEMIKSKKEEKELRRQIHKEARKEALEELKPELKEVIKKQELAKLTGKGKKKNNFLEKLAKGFEGSGNSGNKISEMLGGGPGASGVPSPDIISKMMGRQPEQSQQQVAPVRTKKKKTKRGRTKGRKNKQYAPAPTPAPVESPEDRIKRIIG